MNAMFTGFAMLFALVVCDAATIEMVIRTDDLSEDYGSDYSRDHDRNYDAELPEDYGLGIPNDYNTNQPEGDYMNLPGVDNTNLPEGDYTNLPGVDDTNPPENDYTNLPEGDYTNLPGVDYTNPPEDDYTNPPEGDYTNLPGVDYTNLPGVDYTNLPEGDYANLPGVDYTNLPEVDHKNTPEVFNTDQLDEYNTKMTYVDEDVDIAYDVDLSEDSDTGMSENYGVGYEQDLTLDEDPSQIPLGYLDIDGQEFDKSRVIETLKVNNGGKRGDWGEAKFCPAGSYAAGYDMKIEQKQYIGDDTSLNGIKIVCKNLTGQYVGEVASSVGPWGTWVGRTNCKTPHTDSTDYLTSFSLQVEANQGTLGDDTAANYIKFMCRGKCNSHNYTLVKPPGHGSWGKWGNWSISCPINTAVCGIKTRVDVKQGISDDTALNDAIFYCCK